MKEFENNAYFWQKVDTLFFSGDLEIVNRKGDLHPKYPSLKYPTDYGHIKTLSSDTSFSMEVFKGTAGKNIDGLAICADILTKQFEVKALLGLSEEEEAEVLTFLNQTDFQKSVVIKRGSEIPSWAVVD